MTPLRGQLRALPSIVGVAPPFSLEAAPPAPTALFLEWLQAAIAQGVLEPHAMTLSTVDGDGLPDARVLVLKDIADDGSLAFATGRGSAKGRQLIADPRCALTFYWTQLARAVRIRGVAHPGDAEESAADIRDRGRDARRVALAGEQSTPLPEPVERARLIEQAGRRLAGDPTTIDPDWSLWWVRPSSVEFWHGDPDRNHVRLKYDLVGTAWTRTALWP